MLPRQIPIQDYPFVSPCGNELNFIRPAASPFVFHGLVEHSGDRSAAAAAPDDDNPQLVFGGTLRQPFAWPHLAVSKISGRIYHARRRQEGKSTVPLAIPYGLVRSQLAVSLVEQMEIMHEDDDDDDEELLAYRNADGEVRSVPWLPADAEPGPWAMPWEYEQ